MTPSTYYRKRLTRLKAVRHTGATRRSSSPFFESAIQRKCEKCEEDEKEKVQKKSDRNATSSGSAFFGSYMNGIGAKGQSLHPTTRQFFENRLSGSFGDVKIHTDSEATMAAKAVRAKAFTWQNHIVFNQQYFDEHSTAGQQLLAHELTHVMQQRDDPDHIQRAPEDAAAEPEQEEPTEATPQAAAQEKEATEQEQTVMEPESLPDFQTFGKAPDTVTVFGKTITVQGETKADFDNGTGSTQNLKARPAPKCDGCSGAECISVTGQLVITYNVATSVTLPDMPEGLTECQQQRVRTAIDTKIKPHEDEHVKAFNTYKGTVTLPINFTGCKADLHAHVQAMHDADNEARKTAARAKSDALDPFHVPIDLDCEDKPGK